LLYFCKINIKNTVMTDSIPTWTIYLSGSRCGKAAVTAPCKEGAEVAHVVSACYNVINTGNNRGNLFGYSKYFITPPGITCIARGYNSYRNQVPMASGAQRASVCHRDFFASVHLEVEQQNKMMI